MYVLRSWLLRHPLQQLAEFSHEFVNTSGVQAHSLFDGQFGGTFYELLQYLKPKNPTLGPPGSLIRYLDFAAQTCKIECRPEAFYPAYEGAHEYAFSFHNYSP